MVAALVLTVALVPAPAADASGSIENDAGPTLWHASGRLTSVAPHAFPSSSPTDFGASVAVDDGVAVVGAPYEDAVHVYERMGVTWVPSQVLEGPAGFGEALAVDDSRIAVGAPASSSMLVFEEGGSGWTLASTLTVAGTACLGSSLAIQEDLLAAGDPCGSQSVYLFAAQPTGWAQVHALDVETDDRFGRSVDVSGDTVLVGGDAAHAFDRTNDGGWSGPTLVSSTAGLQVALSGDLAATGSVGKALVFERVAGSWSQVAVVQPHDLSPVSVGNERFSFGLDLAGDTLVVSASRDDSSPAVADVPELASSQCVWLLVAGTCVPQNPGAAYVFERSAEGDWQQVAKLAPEQAAGEDFSTSVAIDDDGGTILAGAPGHPMALKGFVDVQDAVYTFSRTSQGGAP